MEAESSETIEFDLDKAFEQIDLRYNKEKENETNGI